MLTHVQNTRAVNGVMFQDLRDVPVVSDLDVHVVDCSLASQMFTGGISTYFRPLRTA